MQIDKSVPVKVCDVLSDFFEYNLSLNCRPQHSVSGTCSFVCSPDGDASDQYLVKISDTYQTSDADLFCRFDSDTLSCSARYNDFHITFSFDGKKVEPLGGHVATNIESMDEKNRSLLDILSSLELFWIPSSW